jgi:hypothetical protein
MGLLDLISAAAGRPDPAMKIAQAFGQAPGQPGSPQGPQPLVGAAPPAASAGGGGASGASGASPQPQATQTPPDLGQMFLQLTQRQQASEGFNRGLGMLAAGFAQPRDRATMIGAMEGQSGDPGSTMANLMRLQQWNIQQQQMAAYREGVPQMLKGLGLTDEEVKAYTPLAIADPSFATKVAETKLGVGGGPAWMAQIHAEKALTDQGKPIPWTPGDPTSYDAWTKANTAANVTEQRNASEAKLNATSSFSKIDPPLAQQEQNLEWLNDPAHRQAVITAIHNPNMSSNVMGAGAAMAPGLTGIDQDVLTARVKIDQLKKELYADRFVGTKNIRSNTEANNLGAAATLLDSRNNDPVTIDNELQRLVNDIGAARGNLAAAAGRKVPAKYANLIDKGAFLDPKSPLYNGATIEEPEASGGGSASGGDGGGGLKPLTDAQKQQAKELIARDGRDAVISHLKAGGYDTSGL